MKKKNKSFEKFYLYESEKSMAYAYDEIIQNIKAGESDFIGFNVKVKFIPLESK